MLLPPPARQHVSRNGLHTARPSDQRRRRCFFLLSLARPDAALQCHSLLSHPQATLSGPRADHASMQTAALTVGAPVRPGRKKMLAAAIPPSAPTQASRPRAHRLALRHRRHRQKRLTRTTGHHDSTRLLTRSRLSHYSQSEARDTPSTDAKASNPSRTKLCANRARALHIILPPRALGAMNR